MPLHCVIVTICCYQIVLLEDVGRFALLTDDIRSVIAFYKLIENLQFHFAQATENLDGVVENGISYAAGRLVFLDVRANVKVKLFTDLQHVDFGDGIQNLRKTNAVCSISFIV